MTHPSSSTSSVILGAGLMGRLLACELARNGHTVTVYDAAGPDAQGAAARVAAAMLAPLAESAVTEPSVVQMGRHSLVRWPGLISQLDAPVFFQQQGTLILWHRQDGAEALRFGRQMATTSQHIPELPAAQTLDAAQITGLEPSLGSRFAKGMYLPGEGQLDNRQLLGALLAQMEASDMALHWDSPREPEDFSPGQPNQPDWVFDCRGLGAKPQWPALRGVRGEVVRLHAPEVNLSRPTRLLHPRYPIYIAPKQDHVFVIGATEIETEDMSAASVRSTMELLSAAYAVHTGFAEARILEIATQCRPTLPDNLPSIRRLGPRTLQINGLYRHGFLIAPAMLDATMEVLATGSSALAAQWGMTLEHA